METEAHFCSRLTNYDDCIMLHERPPLQVCSWCFYTFQMHISRAVSWIEGASLCAVFQHGLNKWSSGPNDCGNPSKTFSLNSYTKNLSPNHLMYMSVAFEVLCQVTRVRSMKNVAHNMCVVSGVLPTLDQGFPKL